MPRMDRIGKTATTVATENGVTRVTYHKTVVVKFDPGHIVLDSGGWLTMTTKNRMNQASNQFDLGYAVFQEKGRWYVQHGDYTHEFFDGISIDLPREKTE